LAKEHRQKVDLVGRLHHPYVSFIGRARRSLGGRHRAVDEAPEDVARHAHNALVLADAYTELDSLQIGVPSGVFWEAEKHRLLLAMATDVPILFPQSGDDKRMMVIPQQRGIARRSSMCGRVVQKTPLSEIRVLFETVNPVPNAAPNYNGAPTDSLPIVRLDREGRRLDLLRWGLVPYWAKDKSIGPRCINAMAETVATKPTFREAFQRRRCLVPADFFYEWQKTPTGKQPYAFGLADGTPMAFAGLWERWKDRIAGDVTHTFTIITGPSNERLAAIPGHPAA
jgi:putative SOS response-associated peptidase YedK